jgi:hypothetical protein
VTFFELCPLTSRDGHRYSRAEVKKERYAQAGREEKWRPRHPSTGHPRAMAAGQMSSEEFKVFNRAYRENILRYVLAGGVAYLCMDWRHLRELMAATADPDQSPVLRSYRSFGYRTRLLSPSGIRSAAKKKRIATKATFNPNHAASNIMIVEDMSSPEENQ